MSKIVSRSILSVFIVLFIVIITLFSGFKILSNGIHIEQFKIADIQIKGFYLKLNNKFILNIQEINLLKFLSKKTSSQFDLRQNSNYIKYALWSIAYFEQLNIRRIILNDEYIASITYNGKQYALTFPRIKAIFDIQNQNNNIILDIKKLSFTQPDFDISGQLIYSLLNRSVGFGLAISPQDKQFKLFLQGSSNFKTIKFQAQAPKMPSLQTLREILNQNLPKHTMEALDKRLFNALEYEYAELKNAHFNIQLNERNFLKSFFKNTKIDLRVNKPLYSLDSSLSPFLAKQGRIEVHNNAILLHLDSPAYGDTPIGGFLSFSIDKNVPKLHINVNSNTLCYDEKIQDLLRYFNINIPLDSARGDIDTKLDITLIFQKDMPVSVDIGGEIKAQNATLTISNFQFLTKTALVNFNIHPLTGEKHIDIDTQRTIYQNIFDIDTKTRISLLDKKIQTSLMIHTLRVSTNPEINKTLPNLQHLFENIESLDSTQEETIVEETTEESIALSMLKAYYKKLYSAYRQPLAHYAQNEEIKNDAPQTTNHTDTSITHNNNEINDNTNSQEIAIKVKQDNPILTLPKPSEDSAPSEEMIVYDDKDLESKTNHSTQDAHSNTKDSSPNKNLDSTLQTTQELTPQPNQTHTIDETSDIKNVQNIESIASPKQLQENAHNQNPQSNATTPESSAPQKQDSALSQESSIQNLKASSIFHPDFSKPMNPQEMQEAIIKVIEQEKNDKFTYDIFKATHENLPQIDLEIDFNTSPVQINIPQLQTFIKIFSDTAHFNIADLSVFERYSPLMQYLGLQSGNILVYVQNANNIRFKVEIVDYPSFLLDKNGNLIKNFVFYGGLLDDKINVQSEDRLISLNTIDNTTTAKFKNIDVDLNSLISSQIPAIQEAFSTSEKVTFTKEQIQNESEFLRQKRRYERQNGIKPKIISIETQNITGFYKAITLPFDTLSANIRDTRITADATYKNGIANIDIIHGNVLFKAGNFGSEFVNRVLSKDIVSGGLFGATGIYRDGIFKGEAKMQNTSFNGFAMVQNIIGLIDSIPSLIMFRNPGVGAKGYEVSKGKLAISLNANYIGLESIDLIGRTMDVKGNGLIELDTQEVDIGLSISTFKSLSNVLSKIPIAGYLILGKEGKISTQMDVKGLLSDPKIQINLAEDLLSAPLKIIERVFTPIDMIVDEIRKGSD